MARSNAEHLEALKTARDAIVDGMAEGRLTIEYQIRGRVHRTSDPGATLKSLDALIEAASRRAARDSRSTYRVATIQRARGFP